MYLLRISPQSRYIEIQYILYPLYRGPDTVDTVCISPRQVQPDTVDTYRACRLLLLLSAAVESSAVSSAQSIHFFISFATLRRLVLRYNLLLHA